MPTTKREVYDGNKKELYAVFEFVYVDEFEYRIYKLGESIVSVESRDVNVLGEPMYTVKLEDHHPVSMSIFSLGSKIYFCGGFWSTSESPWPNYSCEAYMFDVASKEGTRIQPMKYRKPIPLVLGPDDDGKFYVFSTSRRIQSKVIERSFEILDTRSYTWESLDLPSIFETGVISSTLCGSNILIFTKSGCLLVFYTTSKMWHVTENDSLFGKGPILPYSSLQYLGATKKIGHILLGYPSISGNPQLYSFKAKNDDLEDIGPFMKLGEVEGFRQHFMHMPSTLYGCSPGLYYFDRDSFCLVCNADEYCDCLAEQLVIGVYNISYSGLDDPEVEVKAKVKNFVQYNCVLKTPMMPRHFLAVG